MSSNCASMILSASVTIVSILNVVNGCNEKITIHSLNNAIIDGSNGNDKYLGDYVSWGPIDSKGYPRYVKDFGNGETAVFTIKHFSEKFYTLSFMGFETDPIIEEINDNFYITISTFLDGNGYDEFESSNSVLEMEATFDDCNGYDGLTYLCSDSSISNCLVCVDDPSGVNPCNICNPGSNSQWDNNKKQNVCVSDSNSGGDSGSNGGSDGSNGSDGSSDNDEMECNECINVKSINAPNWNEKDTSLWLGDYCFIGNTIVTDSGDESYPVYEFVGANGVKGQITISPFENPGQLEFFIYLYENEYDEHPIAYFMYIGSGAQLTEQNYISINSDNNPFDGSSNDWNSRGYPGTISMAAELEDECSTQGFVVESDNGSNGGSDGGSNGGYSDNDSVCNECINVKSINAPNWNEQDTSLWLGDYCYIGNTIINEGVSESYPVYEFVGANGVKGEITILPYENPGQLEFFIYLYENEYDMTPIANWLYIGSGAQLIEDEEKYIEINRNNNPFDSSSNDWNAKGYPGTMSMEAELSDDCKTQGFDIPCTECILVESLNTEWEGEDTSKWLGNYCYARDVISNFDNKEYPVYELKGSNHKAEITIGPYKVGESLEYFLKFYDDNNKDNIVGQFLYTMSGAKLIEDEEYNYILINNDDNPLDGNTNEWIANGVPKLDVIAKLSDNCQREGFDLFPENSSPNFKFL